MHECPECGQACDCDGEDTWWDDYPSCTHECEETDDDDGGYSAYCDGQEEPYDGPGTYDYECLAVEAEMKKFANYGTVRFIRQGPVRGPRAESMAMPNFVLCKQCNRYIPRTAFEEHCAAQHAPAADAANGRTPE